MKQYLEAGRLCSPRGIRGEVRFDCWCDSPDFLEGVDKLYLDPKGERFLTVKEYRPTIPSIVFEGYEDRGLAGGLTGRTVYFDRNDIDLPEGVFYNDDLLGFVVVDEQTGAQIGVLSRVDEGVGCFYYAVSGGERDYLIPVNDQFIAETDLQGKKIVVRLIEGL